MPDRDGTGPWSEGSLTGRGLGSCSHPDATGANLPPPWRDQDRGQRRRRGRPDGGEGRGHERVGDVGSLPRRGSGWRLWRADAWRHAQEE